MDVARKIADRQQNGRSLRYSWQARPQSRSPPGSDAFKTSAVADWVRERIRLGKLVPGQRLIEADMVRETGASRSKVREALQRLESEGLVTIEEFRGASVKRLGIERGAADLPDAHGAGGPCCGRIRSVAERRR